MTGSLALSLESVSAVLSAGDLLLLDWVVASCQQFLLTNIHTENVVTAARIASLYRCLYIYIHLLSVTAHLVSGWRSWRGPPRGSAKLNSVI